MPSSFTIVTTTAHTAGALFDLSLDIGAHLRSMARSGETAVGGVMTGHIGLGESVTWRARHFGVWFRLTTTITALDRPTRFVDEQTRGPFRSFRHEHLFDVSPSGLTVMTDIVTVGSPLFGNVVERIVLMPYLRRLITQRNRFLLETLDAGGARD